MNLMLVQLMSAEKSNELVCESSRVLSVPKKKYLKIMGCLEKAEIFPFTYASPQQSIACHPDLSDCSFNRQYLQVHTYHMPGLYFSSSSSSRIQVRTKGT